MMRVLVVGGAGVFGRRLAEGLLATTNAHVLLAGRSVERARRAALAIGAHEAHALDRNTATPDALRALGADLVIDAAGPFQGGDLRFARAVIESGANYLDLADARDFVAALPALDELAKQRGVFAIAGASSTPALTHAVLDELRAGWRRIDVIRAGIAPGNRAERGPSVVKAILTWAGAPVRVYEQGAWRERPGWSDCGLIDVPGLGRRRFALAETPDLDLIPARFKPRDAALFMASLELPLLHRGLQATGALRRWGVLAAPERMSELFRRAGDFFLPFGSDSGGMIVEVFGRDPDDRSAYARWVMIAPDGLGPYTPTFAALALARRCDAGEPPPPGARACVGFLRLDEIEPDFRRMGFATSIETRALVSPFEAALGPRFTAAPAAVRDAHREGPVTRLSGAAQVRGAQSALGRVLARLFGFPTDTESIPLRVTMRLAADGEETWEREFGSRRMKSRLRCVRPGVVRESFGPFHFDMEMGAGAEDLSMRVIAWRLGSVPLPAFLAPRSRAVERQDAAGRFRFDVPIALPLFGLLTHYSGHLVTEEVDAIPASAEKVDA